MLIRQNAVMLASVSSSRKEFQYNTMLAETGDGVGVNLVTDMESNKLGTVEKV